MSQQPSILLMDEDTETLEKLQTVLQRQGYQVFVAADGRAALRLAKTAKPNLIVSDLLLAGLDGYEVWKAIRADKEISHIPILVVSALTIPANNQAWRPTPNAEWQLLSYDAALPKPIDLRRFVRVVEKLLQSDKADTISSGPSAILAIEDENLQNELMTILRKHDFGVETSASIQKALQLARAMPPAALLLDYRLPDQAVKNLVLQANKHAPNTPIILIIDPTQEDDAQLRAHCDGYLTAPIHPIHTFTSLDHILELYNMRQRMQVLSNRLMINSRDLIDAQQALQAQNKELEHINAQLREIDGQKETFIGMMVHDLKSPLGSILGTLNFLVTDPDLDFSGVNQALLNGAIAAGNQMLRLIETLLDGQRLETGIFQAYQEPFDLSTVVDISVEQILPFLSMHELKLECDISDNLPLAYADANVSQRILENLLDNAIKYSPTNTIITINAVSNGDFIKISVADQGPGIPESQRADIFSRLDQLKSGDQTYPRAGLGFGLTFCQLAVQAMGGAIWIESDGKRGAAFVFTLPTYED